MEQIYQSGAQRVDIKGDKLQLHMQEDFGKMEVARIDRDGIIRFYKGVEQILGIYKRRNV